LSTAVFFASLTTFVRYGHDAEDTLRQAWWTAEHVLLSELEQRTAREDILARSIGAFLLRFELAIQTAANGGEHDEEPDPFRVTYGAVTSPALTGHRTVLLDLLNRQSWREGLDEALKHLVGILYPSHMIESSWKISTEPLGPITTVMRVFLQNTSFLPLGKRAMIALFEVSIASTVLAD
jgi:hypothetical protein